MAVIYEAADDLTISGSVRSQAEHERAWQTLLRGAKVLVEPAEHLAGQVGALPADVVRRLK